MSPSRVPRTNLILIATGAGEDCCLNDLPIIGMHAGSELRLSLIECITVLKQISYQIRLLGNLFPRQTLVRKLSVQTLPRQILQLFMPAFCNAVVDAAGVPKSGSATIRASARIRCFRCHRGREKLLD